MRRRPVWLSAVVAIAASASAATVTACGSSGPAAVTDSKPITVVTGLYPIAQAVQAVGEGRITAVDVVPGGVNPRTYPPTASDGEKMRGAALVVEVGGGFQPPFESAAASAPRVLKLESELRTTNPYFWLDPTLMQRAVNAIAASLEQVNPSSASLYRDGARAFDEEVASTGIDFESTLSVCPTHTIVTADGAFEDMARSYGLIDQIANDNPGSAAAAQASGATTAFTEPFVSTSAVEAVARGAHLRVRSLDPLTGAPPGGWSRQADYIRLMEANLGALAGALGCPDTANGTS